jgi:hypothetical protein
MQICILIGTLYYTNEQKKFIYNISNKITKIILINIIKANDSIKVIKNEGFKLIFLALNSYKRLGGG